MRFAAEDVAEAAGAILAHSVGPLRKGRLLTEADCAALAAAGFAQVTVARLGPADVAEDAAALALAQALVPDPGGQGLRLSEPARGRVNIHATGPGIVAVDRAAVDRVNAADPMITLATVPEWHRTGPGAMVATVKIIAYAVAQAALDRACAGAAGALRRLPPCYRSATLIETVIPGHDPGPRGRAALLGRLDRLGVSLTDPVEVGHDEGAIAAALGAAPGEVLFVLTASATSDLADVAPSAVRRAGGEVTRFGMPVDPGNLLFLGRLGARPVIGLPGCARSPALNGADWVMERVICGIDLSASDIGAMGVGGLLKEIPTRPRPREG